MKPSNAAFLALMSLSLMIVPARADTITITNPYVMLDNVSANPEGILLGETIRFGANSVAPNGFNGTTGTGFCCGATPTFSRQLNFIGNETFPNMFDRHVIDTGALRGLWTLSFTNVGTTTNTSSVQVGLAQTTQAPFVQNITVSGTGQNPVFAWTPPAGATVNGYRVNIYDSSIVNARGFPSQIFSLNLQPTTTSFTIPNSGNHAAGDIDLVNGTRYYVEIQLLQTRDGLSNNLGNSNLAAMSRIFSTFTRLPEGSPPNINLPVTLANGSYQFNMTVVAGQTYYIDPTVASGYVFKTNPGDPNFASVILPSLQLSPYRLSYTQGGTLFDLMLAGGVLYDFGPGGVDMFTVTEIDLALGLDPTNPTAFITGLTFVGDGAFTGTQTPITTEIASVPGPLVGAGLPGLALAFGGLVTWYRRRQSPRFRRTTV